MKNVGFSLIVHYLCASFKVKCTVLDCFLWDITKYCKTLLVTFSVSFLWKIFFRLFEIFYSKCGIFYCTLLFTKHFQLMHIWLIEIFTSETMYRFTKDHQKYCVRGSGEFFCNTVIWNWQHKMSVPGLFQSIPHIPRHPHQRLSHQKQKHAILWYDNL